MVMVVLPRHHAEHLPSLPVALEKRLFTIPVLCPVWHEDCRLDPLYLDAAPLYHEGRMFRQCQIHIFSPIVWLNLPPLNEYTA